jgi:hypothetical protein
MGVEKSFEARAVRRRGFNSSSVAGSGMSQTMPVSRRAR